MDAVEIAKVVEGGEIIPIAVLISIGAVPLVKGLFALIAGRHQRRRDFLELWNEGALRNDDLWLEEAIQHRYGAAMPARLIRHVAQSEWPSRKLRKLAVTSDFFELDEAQNQVVWSVRRRGRAHWLEFEMVVCLIGYFLLAPVGVGLILSASRQGLLDGFILVAIGAVFVLVAFKTFWHLISIVEARSTLTLVNGAGRLGFCARLKGKVASWRRERLLGPAWLGDTVGSTGEKPGPT